MNVLGFYAICRLMEPPSAQPLEKTLLFSGEQPGNGASCFSSSLDFTPFFRLLPIESVLRLRQSNCGLPENTSKNNPKLSFPTIVVFKARFFFFLPSNCYGGNKEQKPQSLFWRLLGRQQGNTHERNREQNEAVWFVCVCGVRVTLEAF